MKTPATLLSFLITSAALAQPSNVSLYWQFSVDNGTTWSPSDIIIDSASPTTVRVQGVMAWQSSPPTIDVFAAVQFDPFVARTPGVGASDWIVDPVFRTDNRFQPYFGSSVTALPNILKIDRETDLFPPGEGTGWIVPSQTLAFGEFDSDNPIVIADYIYSLDGTLGVRTVSAALWHNAAGMSAGYYDLDIGTNVQLVSVLPIPGSISVIPAPPAALLALAALAGTVNRRRRA